MKIIKLTSPLLLTKRIFKDEHGTVMLDEYSKAKWFTASFIEVNSLRNLSKQLETLHQDPHALLIRGTPHKDTDLSRRVRRRIYPQVEPDINQGPFVDTPVRWLMIDTDKLKLPDDIDLIATPEAAVRYLIQQLPTEFHNASVHWQLSSKSGVFNIGTVSAHLFYWLKDDATSYRLNQWAININRAYGSRLIDPALFTAVQPHYTANPVFTGVEDPLVNGRSGFIEGQHDEVTIDLTVPTQGTNHKYNIDASTGEIFTTHGYEMILSEMGDDGDGFNFPIIRATASWVSKVGREEAELQWPSIKADIRQRIDLASQVDHTVEKLERYKSDAYLDDQFERALIKYGDADNLPVHFDTTEQTEEECKAELHKTIDAFGDRVKAYWKDPLEYFEPTPTLAIRATAGLGKTTEVIKRLIDHNILELGDIHYYVPSHKLSKQLEGDLDEQISIETDNLIVKKTNVVLGRGRETSNHEPLCHKAELAGRIAKQGLDVSTTLCKNRRNACEFYDTCAYQRQFPDKDALAVAEQTHNDHVKANGGLDFNTLFSEVQVMAHNHLFLRTHNRLRAPKLVVVDEAFWSKAIEELLVAPTDLSRRGTPIAKLIHDTVVNDKTPPLLKTLRDAGFAPEDLRDEADLIDAEVDDGQKITPNLTATKMNEVLEGRSTQIKASLVLRQVADELDAVDDRDVSHVIRYEPRTNTKKDDKNPKSDKLVITRRRRFCISDDVPVLFIDANADVRILKLFRQDVEMVDISAKRLATVHQFTDLTFSKRALLHEENSATLRSRIDEFIKRVALTGKTLVASTKEVREVLTGQEATSDATEHNGASFIHFNNLRGLNAYKDYENVIIVGREQPPVNALEDDARALWWDAEYPLNLAPVHKGNTPPITETRRYRSDIYKTTQVQVHPDERVQALLEQTREAESEQALDRLRLVRNENNLDRHVFLLSDVPLNITVDHFYGWEELQRCLRLWEEADGVLPLNKEHLQVRCPIAAPNKSAAETRIREWKRLEILINIYISKVNLFSVQYRAVGSKAKMSTAIVDAALSEEAVKAALSDAAGTAVEVLAPNKTTQDDND